MNHPYRKLDDDDRDYHPQPLQDLRRNQEGLSQELLERPEASPCGPGLQTECQSQVSGWHLQIGIDAKGDGATNTLPNRGDSTSPRLANFTPERTRHHGCQKGYSEEKQTDLPRRPAGNELSGSAYGLVTVAQGSGTIHPRSARNAFNPFGAAKNLREHSPGGKRSSRWHIARASFGSIPASGENPDRHLDRIVVTKTKERLTVGGFLHPLKGLVSAARRL